MHTNDNTESETMDMTAATVPDPWTILLRHERTAYYRVTVPGHRMPTRAVAPVVITTGPLPAPDVRAAEQAANATARAAVLELGARAVADGTAEPLGVEDEGLTLLGYERADGSYAREALGHLRKRIEQAPGRVHADEGRNAATLRALAALAGEARLAMEQFDAAGEGDSNDAELVAAAALRATLEAMVDLVETATDGSGTTARKAV